MTMNSKRVKKSEKPSLVLVNGSDALTAEGMERIWNALTGKDFTPEDRIWCQEKIDVSNSLSTGTISDTEKGQS
jgi:hypothetical protein